MYADIIDEEEELKYEEEDLLPELLAITNNKEDNANGSGSKQIAVAKRTHGSVKERRKTIFDKIKIKQQYFEILLSDPKFKNFYSQSLYEAIFTFPKFRRQFSKNYRDVQLSFRKVSKSKEYHQAFSYVIIFVAGI